MPQTHSSEGITKNILVPARYKQMQPTNNVSLKFTNCGRHLWSNVQTKQYWR